jgi:5-methylcytosine-specific restriction endonuclease McrA
MTDAPARRQPDRAERLVAVLVRDGDRCVWCGRAFTGLVQPTTDHLVPRVKGGPSWIENEVAACRRCNGQRGHTTPLDWLHECERRGWSPNRAALTAALQALHSAIAARGGRRRAARYLDAQRRRWGPP